MKQYIGVNLSFPQKRKVEGVGKNNTEGFQAEGLIYGGNKGKKNRKKNTLLFW